MPNPPSGTITFLFTDIEGSTNRWEQYPQQMRAALARHDALLRAAIETNNGYVFKTMGDAFCAAFPTALDALTASVSIQRSLAAETWGEGIGSLLVRAALHTGTAEERDGDYFGPPLNRVARLLSAGHGGQTLLSSSAQELVRDALPEGVTLHDMGERRLKDLIRPEHVFQLVAPDLPSAFPALKTLDTRSNNLPGQSTLLTGREKELRAAYGLLSRPEVRLVTFTGPGGTGKTRLALQLAADLIDSFSNGVYFVNLAPIKDSNLVVSTIAQTLGIREIGGQPLIDTLGSYLHEKEMLLVLDNFEQVTQASPQIAQLLTTAPKLKVLATSRGPLRLKGEKEFPVPPMGLPPVSSKFKFKVQSSKLDDHEPGTLNLELLTQYEAVRLFIERATDIKSDFQVTNDNAPAVVEICHRLDGLPLAIELAAARIRLLSPQVMLARLQNRLKLLTGGTADLPARHQTLRAAIEWSYDLLTPEEQKLFRRISVFVGGCALESMEEVCDADGDLDIDVLDGVESLVAKSLLKSEQGVDEEPRFVMLETIHEYAEEKLGENGETWKTKERHLAYFLALAEEAVPHLNGSKQAEWLERLEAEHDNLRTALRWTRDIGNVKSGLALAGALWVFWQTRGYYTEGLEHLRSGLDMDTQSGLDSNKPSVETMTLRAQALRGISVLARMKGDYKLALTHIEESLAIYRRLGDDRQVADALNSMALIVKDQGDVELAYSLLLEALTLKKGLEDKRGIAKVLGNLGILARRRGDDVASQEFTNESLMLYRELGDKRSISFMLNNLAITARRRGDNEAAFELHQESLIIKREVRDKRGIASSLVNLAIVAQDQGKISLAQTLLAEGLVISSDTGDRLTIASCFEEMGRAALSAIGPSRDQVIHAIRLWGANEALREAIGSPLPLNDVPRFEETLNTARAVVDDATWKQAWQQGKAMTMEQAIAYALAQK
jgi:predicted ATPase/class 3 adenylate cyclase